MRPLIALVIAAPLLAQDAPPPYPWEVPQERQALLDQVRLTRVSLDATDVPLSQALGFVTAELGLAVDLSAAGDAAEKKVTAKAQDIDMDSALHMLLDPLSLAYAVEPGKLVVAPPDKLPAGSPAEEVLAAIQALRDAGHGEEAEHIDTAALRRRLLDLPLVMEFKDKTLAEVLQFVKDYSRFEYVLEPAARAGGRMDEKLTISLQAKTTWEGLESLLDPRGLGIWLAKSVVHVDAKEEAAKRNAAAEEARAKANEVKEKRIDLDVEGKPVQVLAAELEKAAQMPVVMDRETWAQAPIVTLKAKGMPLGDLLDKVREQTMSSWYLWKGRIYLIR